MLCVTPAPTNDADQYLARCQVAQLLQVDVRTVDRNRADAMLKFPHPIYLPHGQPGGGVPTSSSGPIRRRKAYVETPPRDPMDGKRRTTHAA